MKRFKAIGIKLNKISKSAVIAFLMALTLCYSMVIITIYNRVSVEKLQMEQVIMDKSVKITEVVSRLLYKTEALAALVIQGEGQIENFGRVAAMVIDDPAILNVLIAPDGVVSDVYPLYGNEAVIGLDFFSEGAGNNEAIMAVNTGKLVFGGPFELVQGGQALVGRLPVYLDQPDRSLKFWGIVSVTLKHPQALDGAGLGVLEKQGYAYELWRYSADDGSRQIIATGENKANPRAHFIEKQISILNADWYFRVSPVRQWHQYPENWVLVFSALIVSLMVGFVMQNNHSLKVMKREIEFISQTDFLTGIRNRRFFMDRAPDEIEKLCSQSVPCYVTILDIDNFKNLNDTYGHHVGDLVLKEFAVRIDNAISHSGLFARYGGEEFIILSKDMDCDMVMELMERARRLIYEKPFEADGASIYISASFGVSSVASRDDFEDALKRADSALYMAKRQGRNRVVVHGQTEIDKLLKDKE